MKETLENIIALLLREYEVDISKYNDSFLLKSLEKRMTDTGNDSQSKYYDYIKANQNEVKAFIDSLNINYSEFFRNPLTFAYLEQIVLPSLIEKKKKNNEKEIRIWSAACASGQEAYSIAILCDEIIESAKTNIGCRIFATDISEEEISNAQKGVFQTSSLNKVSLKRIQTYFTRRGETYTIASLIKEHINFSVFDLLTEQGGCPPASVYGNFDLVFCSNLLFYYKPECRKSILEKVGKSLSHGGYLITGETEREIVKSSNYNEVFLNSVIFQKGIKKYGKEVLSADDAD